MVDIAEIDARAACIGNGFEYVYEQLHLFIYFDKKKMRRQAGFEEMLVSPAKRDPNEMGGDYKNEIGFDVHHIYEQIDVKVWKTRPIMVEKCQILRNEIKTRSGDSVNLLYWGHRTNKSRRYPPHIYVEHVL